MYSVVCICDSAYCVLSCAYSFLAVAVVCSLVFFVVYTLFADDVADDEQVGHDCFGHVVVAEVSGGVVCDVGVVVDLV